MAGRSRANMAAGEIDVSWQKWTRCKICQRRICVNNNAEREIRPHRRLGVVCCPWCTFEAVFCYVIARELAKAEDKARIKYLQKKARKFMEASDLERNKIAQKGI